MKSADFKKAKIAIESLMDYNIPQIDFPLDVNISEQLLPEEGDRIKISKNRSTETVIRDAGFHDKKEKNKKTNIFVVSLTFSYIF